MALLKWHHYQIWKQYSMIEKWSILKQFLYCQYFNFAIIAEWTMKHLLPCVCYMWYLFFHSGMYFTTTLAATLYLFYHHGIMYFTTTTMVSILSITSPLKKRVGICRENIGRLWWELRLLFKSNPLKLLGHFRSIWSNLVYVLCSNLIL